MAVEEETEPGSMWEAIVVLSLAAISLFSFLLRPNL